MTYNLNILNKKAILMNLLTETMIILRKKNNKYLSNSQKEDIVNNNIALLNRK